MMILHHFRGDELKSSIEGKFRKKLKLKGYDLMPAISIASYLKKEGFSVFVHHQNPSLFWDGLRKIDPILFDLQIERYRYASMAGVNVDNRTEINAEILQSYIDMGALIICGIEFVGVKHAVLLCEINDRKALYLDPISGRQLVFIDTLLESMKTSFGTWCIAVHQ